jgi:hypothetical protein
VTKTSMIFRFGTRCSILLSCTAFQGKRHLSEKFNRGLGPTERCETAPYLGISGFRL